MRRRTWLLTVVAFIAGCAGDAAVDSTTTEAAPATTTTTIAVITTTVAATTTTLDEWDAVATWRGGSAGEYRSRLFGVPFKFTTTSAWDAGGGETAEYLGIGKGDSGVFLGVWEGPVEDVVERYKAMETVEVTDEQETEIGGASGVVIEGTVSADTIIRTFPDGTSVGWAEGTRFSTHIVDVNGRTVELSIDRLGVLPPNFEEQAQALLDSIVWKDLAG